MALSLPGTGLFLLVLVCSAQTPPDPAVAKTPSVNEAFEKMKTLVGEWESKRPNGTVLRNSFRLFGEGSALLNLEQPEGRQEIITIFYPVGAELWGDHYCFMKNQPRYVAVPSSDPNVITFDFRDITNLAVVPNEAHMHSTTWRFTDSGHLTQEWHVYVNGKEVHVNRLEFTRVR
jgi:hypothetical protein